jgi:uncharacterized protein YlzI (FlbEa/FlbD family)
MAESVGGFVKVVTPEGTALYLNPHHVSVVEAGFECIVRLHDGSKITLAENAEELIQSLQLYLPRPGHHVGLRQRRRRRGS